MEFKFNSPDEAFTALVDFFSTSNLVKHGTSRNGETLYLEEPLTVTYLNPLDRVLLNPARDANPFFHLYEAMWMLAGRNDLKPLQYFVSNFGDYSDDDKTLNGAYGYRWRNRKVSKLFEAGGEEFKGDEFWRTEKLDQLSTLIEHLKEKPDSRRAVLQMWNVQDDLLKIDESADVCCNLSVCFSIRDPDNGLVAGPEHPKVKTGEWVKGQKMEPLKLDMTVFNRSNDIIYGLLGANLVHFSFLQEYMALALGVEVGRYHQITNNAHAYKWNWKPEEWLSADKVDQVIPLKSTKLFEADSPIVFDKEVLAATDLSTCCGINYGVNFLQINYGVNFLQEVYKPMVAAYKHHKEGETGIAVETLEKSGVDSDWKTAGINWLTRRLK